MDKHIRPLRAAFALAVVGIMGSAAAQDGTSVTATASERLPMSQGSGSYPRGTCAPQTWPREALLYEITGMARVDYRISPEGRVTAARIKKSSGWALLDDASVAAAKTCTFTPDQAALAQDREVPVQFVWRLEGERIYPMLVPGSCAASAAVDEFKPFDKRPTDATGVKVRFLIDGNLKPYNVKVEGQPDAAVAEDIVQYLATCRFAFDPEAVGMHTHTMNGRVLLR